MTKVIIELEIETSEGEEIEAVLNGYFSHQSHIKGRKASLISFTDGASLIGQSAKVEINLDNKSDAADRLAKARAVKAAKKAAESEEEKKDQTE